jgi:hypothetical protein
MWRWYDLSLVTETNEWTCFSSQNQRYIENHKDTKSKRITGEILCSMWLYGGFCGNLKQAL